MTLLAHAGPGSEFLSGQGDETGREDEAAELQRLRTQNAWLKEENEMLHKASALSSRWAGKT